MKQLNVEEIIKILPHRYPFLLVDRIVDVDTEKGTITAVKNLTINEAFFQGHFPEVPLMPGVLILEALAQAGGVLVHLKGKGKGKIAVLLNIKNAKFRSPARPGDVLKLHCEEIHLSDKGGRVKATASVGEKVSAEAEIAFALVNKEDIQ